MVSHKCEGATIKVVVKAPYAKKGFLFDPRIIAFTCRKGARGKGDGWFRSIRHDV